MIAEAVFQENAKEKRFSWRVSGSSPCGPKRFFGGAENGTAKFVCAVSLQEAFAYELIEDINRQLIDSVGVINNLGGLAIFAL
jgi:hypothetical protein